MAMRQPKPRHTDPVELTSQQAGSRRTSTCVLAARATACQRGSVPDSNDPRLLRGHLPLGQSPTHRRHESFFASGLERGPSRYHALCGCGDQDVARQVAGARVPRSASPGQDFWGLVHVSEAGWSDREPGGAERGRGTRLDEQRRNSRGRSGNWGNERQEDHA